MMKRMLALLLVLVMILAAFAGCGKKPDQPDTPTEPTGNAGQEEPTEVDDGICETAQEFVDNMTVGWNLGCSLSAFSKTTIDGWGVMAYFLTPDGLYSRSEVFSFDPETKTAEITWKLGQDNGVMQVYEGAQMDGIGIELWNFSLSEADVLNYSIDELRYVTKDGEVAITEGIGAMSTDMGGGTGGGIVADLDEPEVVDILEIHAKVTYIEQVAGEPTPESIAAIELSWGNPLTTQEMIDTVRDRGFNMIRLQVSYVNHMDEEGNIDALWLDRVQEVVDYCMNAGVYCLLNTTGAGWMTADPDTFEEQSKIYRRLWEQIAPRFADYGELLLFESCNEVLNAKEQWWNPPTECHDVMNQFYQIFVDTVRASGGYNETRNLVLNPYAATYSYEMTQYFKLPTDTVEGHLIAQVHCYEPNIFTMNETNLGHADFVDMWGTDEEKAALEEIMKNIRKRFIEELGIPVIIGEFGVVSRVAEEERAEYVGYYAHLADKYGIKLVIFDDGGDFTLFDRDLLIWPYPMIVDALFNKTTEGLGLDPNRPVAEDIPSVEAPKNPLEGWYAVAYFSGTDGSYNRSDFVSFDKETMTAEILWMLGKDNGVLAASGAAGIDCIGVDIWQQVSDSETPAESIQYRIDEVKYYTAEGAVYITPAEAICSATMKNNGGVYAGGGQIANIDDPKVSDVKAIYLKVTFDAGSGTIGGGSEDEGNKPVKEAIPSVSTPSNPMSDWYVVAYFSGSDSSYNRSDMALFNADTKTAEILWKPGRDGGVLAAAGNATFGAIGLDFWNVPNEGERQTSVTYKVKSVKYYTDEGAYYLYPTQSTFTSSLRDNGMFNAGGGNIAMVDNETVSNVRAIYVKVEMVESQGEEKPEEKPDDPVIGGVELPEVTARPENLHGWWMTAAYFIGTNDEGSWNRSGYSMFAAETQTAEILWKFGEGDALAAAPDTIIENIGLQVFDGANKATNVAYTIEEVKYYTIKDNAYQETSVQPLAESYAADLTENSIFNTEIANIGGKTVEEIAAIYVKVKMLETETPDTPDVPDEPVETPDDLPTVTPPTNTMGYWYAASNFIGKDDGKWNRADYTPFDAETKTAEILWKFGQNGVLDSGADMKIDSLGLQLIDGTGAAQNVEFTVKEIKYYTAIEGGYKEHIVEPAAASFAPALSGGTFTVDIATFDPALTVGDVAAIYVKVYFGVEEPADPPVQLPTITPPTSTMGYWYAASNFIGKDDGKWNRADYTPFDAETKTAEILWKFGENGVLDSGADMKIDSLGLQLIDGTGVAQTADFTVLEIKYYTAVEGGYKEYVVEPAAASFSTTVSSGTFNAEIAKFDPALTVADVAAVYVKVYFGVEEPADPPVQLPTITPPTSTMGYWYAASNFIGKDDGKWNRADYTPFDAETKTAEILWKFGENGVLDSGADMKIDSLGLQLIDGTGVAQTADFTVLEIKYYTAVEGGYKEYVVEPAAASFSATVSSGTFNAEIAKFDPALTVADVAAVYVKVYFGVEEEKVILEKLPTITPTAAPMGYWYTAAYFIGKDDGKWNRSDYCQFDANSKTVEVLWELGKNGVLDSGADMKIDSFGLQLIDGTSAAQTAAFTVLEVKYYTAVEGGYEEHVIKLDQTAFELTVSGGSFTADITKVDPALTVGDVVAVYVKASFSA